MTGNSGASVRTVARRRRLRLRDIPGRGPLGRAAYVARRKLPQNTVGRFADRVAETVRGYVHSHQRSIRVPAVHNVGALRSAENHRPLVQLRAVDPLRH